MLDAMEPTRSQRWRATCILKRRTGIVFSLNVARFVGAKVSRWRYHPNCLGDELMCAPSPIC